MTGIPPQDRPQDPGLLPDESSFDWRRINRRWIGIGAGVVALGGLVYWFVTGQQARKEQNAERSLGAAKQSIATANVPLAQADLQKIVTRWSDTRAGVEAGLLLAGLHYDKGEYQKGIEALRKVAGEAGDVGLGAATLAMIADGQLQLGKPAEAAKGYREAAEAARFAGERSYELAKAARAFAAANDTASARAAWERVTRDPEANEGLMAEARVRLGELEARPAGRS